MRTRHVRVSGLSTHVWLPDGVPHAVLVARTPYGAAQHAAEAAGWTAHGIALVVQDVRGRHGSPGDFVPYREHLLDDGPELLAWVRTWADAPVVLLGTSYGAHAAVATATVSLPDAVAVAVPALGLGETARTRGRVLQLASRLGWWLTHGVRRPWSDVVEARRHDAERAAAVSRLTCPLLAIGGTDDFFAHDTLDLWSCWGGPARLDLGPWDHSLHGARRARRILSWLESVLAGAPHDGATVTDRSGHETTGPPPRGTVRLATDDEHTPWCASLTVRTPDGSRREVAHGAAFGDLITLGPVVLTPDERVSARLSVRSDDFPRYARSRRPHGPVPDHHLEIA